MTAYEFKKGDRVYAKFRGYGTVTDIYEEWTAYPIEITWDKCPCKGLERSTYTKEGNLSQHYEREDTMLTVVPKEEKGAEEMGQIARGINHNISSKKGEKMDTKSEKFKVGDHVWSPHFGGGIVTKIAKGKDAFPVKVKWGGGITLVPDYDEFTKDGQFDLSGANPDLDIYSVEPDRADKVILDLINELTKKPEEDEGVVDRMEDALSKKVDDAINPSHYKVKGLSEAYEIINHLMHREQYEGFLWGNIIKYAYRYGRKGNKAETAGKIEWYANQLKDLEEEKNK